MRDKHIYNITIPIEAKIKEMVEEMGLVESIKKDGNLSDKFILNYLLKHNSKVALDYHKILKAYGSLKKQDEFIKGTYANKVSNKTLNRIILHHEAIVRPLNGLDDIRIIGANVGQVLKLPAEKSSYGYDDGDSWKSLVQKERTYKVGDKVIYDHKATIIMDFETLHLVSYFTGKIID